MHACIHNIYIYIYIYRERERYLHSIERANLPAVFCLGSSSSEHGIKDKVSMGLLGRGKKGGRQGLFSAGKPYYAPAREAVVRSESVDPSSWSSSLPTSTFQI